MNSTEHARHGSWELLITTVIGALGLFLILAGSVAFAGVLIPTTVWKPIILRLEVSYLLVVTAGVSLCFSAHFARRRVARRRDWRALIIATAAGALLCGMFYVINPDPIPLR